MAKEEAQSEMVEYQPEISDAHQQYLLRHHGIIDLDPRPEMDDADPLNWPKAKKLFNLGLVSFYSATGTFSAASIMSDFVNIAQDLNVTVQSASYLTSLFIVILGAAPLFWRPLSQAYGRRPVFLISLIGSLIGNVGCALSPSFGTMALCRAITAFFISPAASIGSQVVSETFFKAERARYMGIWTVMVTLGVPAAPFIFGLAGFGQAYRWIYWILAMVNAVQFILYFLFGPESRYIRGSFRPDDGSWLRQRLLVRRIDPSPITLSTFIHPLSLTGRIRVLLPAISHSMVFLWGSVATTFEIPQIYPRQFHFTERQVGLQFIAVLVGTVLGEQLGGFLSDKWMVYGRNLHGKKHNDEFRLWLAYPGQILTIVGTVMFFVLLGGAKAWTVTPVVGAGISAAGNQIVTTTMITYAVDCYPQDSAAVGVIIVLIRQTWGFIGPFWLPQLVESIGLAKTAAIAAVMMIGVSVIPTAVLQLLRTP